MLVKGSLEGEVYAFGEMAEHMSMLRASYAHFSDLSLRMVGIEDCGSPFTRHKKKQTATEKFSVRHFFAIQRALETQEFAHFH